MASISEASIQETKEKKQQQPASKKLEQSRYNFVEARIKNTSTERSPTSLTNRASTENLVKLSVAMTTKDAILLFTAAILAVCLRETPAPPVSIRCQQYDFKCHMNNVLDRMIARTQREMTMDTMSQGSEIDSEDGDLIWHPNYHMDFKCFACQETIDLVRVLFRHGAKERAIDRFIMYMCKRFHIETDSVCDSVIPLFRKEVLFVFEHLVLEPDEICGFLLNDCGDWYNPMYMWKVTLPNVPKPPVVDPVPPPAGSSMLRILHISDIHFDGRYQPGAHADCNEPLCCRATSSQKGAERKAGYWGSYGDCDIPYWTLENMMEHISKHEEFDLVYWTGDLPPHDVWEQTRVGQIDIYKNITSLFKKYFKVPVYSALGNHESAPVDSFPPVFITGNMSISWLYDELENSWTNWVAKNETSRDIKYGAYYSTLIKPGLRVVSINTNYCNNLNFWLLLNVTDPNSELSWLAKTLQKAEDNSEKVHIIGHIPPGYSDCLKAWSYNYYKIIERYEGTVAAQFFGHTHNDHYQVFYEIEKSEREILTNHISTDDVRTKKRPLGVAFIAPSVTTFPDLNPGYRIYIVDAIRPNATAMVVDHETFIANLTNANASPTTKPEWVLEYVATHAFGLDNLFPKQLDALVDKLAIDDERWERFLKFYYKGRPLACDAPCKEEFLLGLRSGRFS